MEDFVTFEIAKKLKEKGFNWICSRYYRTKSKDLFMVFPCEDWSDIKEIINAPTTSQVLKWLREEKGLHICISLGEFSDWDYEIALIDGNIFCAVCEDSHSSYEAAALAGIEYCLDNLI